MGERGPVPKRTEQRRRTNKDPAGPVTKAAAGAPSASRSRTQASPASRPPVADRKWHPLARRWFDALKRSGQSRFYEPSDWMTAVVWAEILSQQLKAEKMSAMMLTAWDAASARLLVTEGDRRRMRLELEKPKPVDEDQAAGVASMESWRARLGGA
jgi:hypothetical protein